MHSTTTVAAAFLSLLFLTSAHDHQKKTIDITVGAEGKLAFKPENVKANVGDTLSFTFFPKNHTVVSSSFDNPCKPTGGDEQIFAGFIPVADDQQGPQKFLVTVRDDKKPLWLYCAQTTGNHCQAGMAMVVNEPQGANTLAAYKEKAKQSGTSEVPPTIGNGVFRPNDKAAPSQCSKTPTTDAKEPVTGQYHQGNGYENKGVDDQTKWSDKKEGQPKWDDMKDSYNTGANAYIRARSAKKNKHSKGAPTADSNALAGAVA